MTTLQGAGSVGVSPGEGEGATRGTRNSSAGLAAGGGPAAAGAGVVSGRRGEGEPRGGEAEGGTGWGCELEAAGGEGGEAEGRRSRRREGRGAMKEALLVQRIGIGAPSSITSFFAEQKGAPFPVQFSLRSRTRPLRFFFPSPYMLHPLPFPAFTLARLRMCTWANEAFLCFGSEEEGEKCLFLPRCVCVRCAQSSSSSWCLRGSSTTRHTYSSSVPPLPCFSKCTNEVGRDCGCGGGGRRRCNSSTHTHTPASGERRRKRDEEEEEEEALCDSGLYPSPPALARLAMALQRFPFPLPPRASFPPSLFRSISPRSTPPVGPSPRLAISPPFSPFRPCFFHTPTRTPPPSPPRLSPCVHFPDSSSPLTLAVRRRTEASLQCPCVSKKGEEEEAKERERRTRLILSSSSSLPPPPPPLLPTPPDYPIQALPLPFPILSPPLSPQGVGPAFFNALLLFRPPLSSECKREREDRKGRRMQASERRKERLCTLAFASSPTPPLLLAFLLFPLPLAILRTSSEDWRRRRKGKGRKRPPPPPPLSFDANEVAAGRGGGRGRRGRVEEGRRRRRHPSKWERTRRKEAINDFSFLQPANDKLGIHTLLGAYNVFATDGQTRATQNNVDKIPPSVFSLQYDRPSSLLCAIVRVLRCVYIPSHSLLSFLLRNLLLAYLLLLLSCSYGAVFCPWGLGREERKGRGRASSSSGLRSLCSGRREGGRHCKAAAPR